MVAIDLTTGGDDLPDGVRAASERVWERDGPGRPGPGRRPAETSLLATRQLHCSRFRESAWGEKSRK